MEETQYIWTKKAEKRWREVIRERGYNPDTVERRVAGEPARCVFAGWKAKGYIEEAE